MGSLRNLPRDKKPDEIIRLGYLTRKIESWDLEDITVLRDLYNKFSERVRGETLLSVPSVQIPEDLIDFSFIAIDRHGNCLMKSGEIETVESLRIETREDSGEWTPQDETRIDHIFTPIGLFSIRERVDFWEVEEPAGHFLECETREDAEEYIEELLRTR